MTSKGDIFLCQLEIILNSLVKLSTNIIHSDFETLLTFQKVSQIISIDIVP